jgi:hypothetical protein
MQVGYSDGDCVSSGWYEGKLLERHLLEILADRRISEVWVRATPTGAAFELKVAGTSLIAVIPGS